MWNKIFLLFVLVMPNATYAAEGTFTFIQQGDNAPFTGTLFDPSGTARLVAAHKFMKEEDLDPQNT